MQNTLTIYEQILVAQHVSLLPLGGVPKQKLFKSTKEKSVNKIFNLYYSFKRCLEISTHSKLNEQVATSTTLSHIVTENHRPQRCYRVMNHNADTARPLVHYATYSGSTQQQFHLFYMCAHCSSNEEVTYSVS